MIPRLKTDKAFSNKHTITQVGKLIVKKWVLELSRKNRRPSVWTHLLDERKVLELLALHRDQHI